METPVNCMVDLAKNDLLPNLTILYCMRKEMDQETTPQQIPMYIYLYVSGCTIANPSHVTPFAFFRRLGPASLHRE
jgi:hypothetical protein